MDATRLFLDDFETLLIKLQNGIEELRKNGHDAAVLTRMMRDLHSVKSIAGLMEYNTLMNFAYKWEDAVKPFADGAAEITPVALDAFTACYDAMADLHYLIIAETFDTVIDETDERQNKIKAALAGLHHIDHMPEKAIGEAAAHELYKINIPSREINFEKFPEVLRQLNDVGTVADITAEMPSVISGKDNSIGILFRTRASQQDILNKLSGYGFDVRISPSGGGRSEEASFFDELYFLFYALESKRKDMTFQQKIEEERKTSLNQILSGLARSIGRDAEQNGKKVSIRIDDRDVKIDKSIIELVRETAMLIARNAIAHGIETPDERVKAGKTERGRVTFKKYFEKDQIVLEIGDDGQGIDVEKIRQKSAEKSGRNLNGYSEKDLLDLLFDKGVSTREQADIDAGRGVGLTRVKENAKKLGGSVFILTTRGGGARFFVKFPRDVLLIRGIEIILGGGHYLVPFFYLKMPYSIGGTTIRIDDRELRVDSIIGEREIGIVSRDISILTIDGINLPIVKLAASQ